MSQLHAWTDGACSGNPGPGGWGVVLRATRDGQILRERELSGGEAQTTNNRMELMAAIAALEALTRPSTITITTDSAYVKNGVTQWIHGWKRNGWRTADRKPVRNAELWQRLDAAQARHKVRWEWIKGHAGHPENERADALARAGMAPFKPARPGRPPDGTAEGAQGNGAANGTGGREVAGSAGRAAAGPAAGAGATTPSGAARRTSLPRPAGAGRGR